MDKINSIWAYISEDAAGNEGVCGYNDPRTSCWIPMLAADETRLMSLKPFAHQIAVVTKQKVKIVKFHKREDLGVVGEGGR